MVKICVKVSLCRTLFVVFSFFGFQTISLRSMRLLQKRKRVCRGAGGLHNQTKWTTCEQTKMSTNFEEVYRRSIRCFRCVRLWAASGLKRLYNKKRRQTKNGIRTCAYVLRVASVYESLSRDFFVLIDRALPRHPSFNLLVGFSFTISCRLFSFRFRLR